MALELVETADGSHTLYNTELNEHFHSVHGAVQESRHVFIEHGLKAVNSNSIDVLEVGFGTGLNCALTALQNEHKIQYTAIEKYPLNSAQISKLNYFKSSSSHSLVFTKIHDIDWNEEVSTTSKFTLKKLEVDVLELQLTPNRYHLIYFDAFAPRVQPELWETEVFLKMYNTLKPNGILVTYCAKGQVKRNMKEAGFTVEPLPGPPGKREMTRARKT